MNRRTAFAIAAIALSLVLSACGNKGPLVLPDKPAETSGEAASTPPAPAEEGAKTPGH